MRFPVTRFSLVFLVFSLISCSGGGTSESDGLSSLTQTTNEPAGANCAQGGTRIDTGLDNNADEILQPDEITDTQYLCATGEVLQPSVTSAVSLSNQYVILSFTQEMGEGAEDAGNYAIVQENVNTESGGLTVVAAEFYGQNHKSVRLTTLSQNGVIYRVTVTNVYNVNGIAMAPSRISGGTVLNPSTATFAGTPPNLNSIVDSDGDGLYDHEEQRGWQVAITRVDGTVEVREVTSDPFEPDSDGDGLDDALELNLRSDPRDKDSDDDQLNDAYEYNALLTELLKQDSDGDGISDDLEVNFFRTSPLQTDTDGDQIPDNEEVLLAARNARVADMPQPSIEIISTDLQLDVRFEESNSSGTRDLESRSVSTTLTQSEEKTSARTRSNFSEVSAKVTAGFSYGTEVGGNPAKSVISTSASLSVEASTSHSWSSSWTEESTRASQDEYARSRDTEAEVSAESTVVRRVDGASMKAAVMLGSLGDIAFNISNIQIVALVPDARDPGVFKPVATLVPEVVENSYTLGPLVGERGPIIFASKEVFPAQVERLMKDPTGVIFKISNYNIIDELGRDFAFTSQDVIDRTTLLSIDYGTRDSDGDGLGDGSELYRVATSLGSSVGDVIDQIAADAGVSKAEAQASLGIEESDVDALVAYSLSGEALGVKFHDIMQNVLGFTHYDEDVTPTSALTPTLQGRSYSTRIVDGIEHIVRIRQTCNYDAETCIVNPASYRHWSTLTSTGLLPGGELSFSDHELPQPRDDAMLPGKSVTLAYVQDQDLDSIPARLEVMHGCDDNQIDSDGDGLNDRLEVFGAAKDANGFYINPADKWTIEVNGKGTYEGFSGCNSTDSDADGISDYEEYGAKEFDLDNPEKREPNASPPSPRSMFWAIYEGAPGDPDLLDDRYRLNPSNYLIVLDDTGEKVPVTGINNFVEFAPGKYDLVLNHEELDVDAPRTLYYAVPSIYTSTYWWNANGDGTYQPLGRMDAQNPDTDEDGISDYDELNGYRVDLYFAREAHSQCVDDTASDAPIHGVICTSDPLNPDTDGDSLPDGLEIVFRADPSIDDGDDVVDLDNDGLIGREEVRGWPVTVTWLDPVSGIVETTTCDGPSAIRPDLDCRVHENKRVTSAVLVYDTDGDGLGDYQEHQLGIHPNDEDSDNDGRSDFAEVYGYAADDLAPTTVITSRPDHYDTDGDGVNDGDELKLYDVGPVYDRDGVASMVYQVSTNPNRESDTDGLTDLQERTRNTDANRIDTDGDRLNDLSELLAGSDPLRADQVCVEAYFKSVEQLNSSDCDGAGAANGGEFLGLLWVVGERSIPVPYLMDKNLSPNSIESIPGLNFPIYALLDNANPIRFYTTDLKECDGVGETGAEGKGDGAISGHCKLPSTIDSVDYNYTYGQFKDGQTEIILPAVNETGDPNLSHCKLQFTVEVKPVTDALVNQPDQRGLNFFCGGAVLIE